ncbi:DUF4158 domain-containing protein [Nonomuraea jabiensis]|uniref:DUF4158 domain-containing protein n=1 Tax=Nonomuraea jabiensis TaxID=882448 RepID=UPI003689496F
MPAEFLSAEQRAAYASFAEMPSLSDLEKFFFLDDFDRNVIAQSRADSHRLGVAVQIGRDRALQGVVPGGSAGGAVAGGGLSGRAAGDR